MVETVKARIGSKNLEIGIKTEQGHEIVFTAGDMWNVNPKIKLANKTTTHLIALSPEVLIKGLEKNEVDANKEWKAVKKFQKVEKASHIVPDMLRAQNSLDICNENIKKLEGLLKKHYGITDILQYFMETSPAPEKQDPSVLEFTQSLSEQLVFKARAEEALERKKKEWEEIQEKFLTEAQQDLSEGDKAKILAHKCIDLEKSLKSTNGIIKKSNGTNKYKIELPVYGLKTGNSPSFQQTSRFPLEMTQEEIDKLTDIKFT